ncbi:hypothetical protein SAY86_014728 [Trapa natans]|uniref:RING-type E3 ubiquitin transferase n=1 Tax=Trapa natans TaxID=22666 RepID=A0AAN7KIG9_TRANT|nr:hypothetical protein SAY86_014728 [Trapa natans]
MRIVSIGEPGSQSFQIAAAMSNFGEPTDDDMHRGYSSPSGYALRGRIMLSAIIILLFVVILMVVLHLYARWYLLRYRRRRFLQRNRHNRRTHIVFYVDPAPSASRGLEASVLSTLPVFSYSNEDRHDPLECAVCLSELEEGEKARLLPKCGHSFHIECIDMWFHSHSTCPLCRSPVETVQLPENLPAPASSISDPNPISALCTECHHCDEHATSRPGSSSVPALSSGDSRKPTELVGVSVEVPPRRTELEDETSPESPASQYRSPMSRMLSFRRILSRERRGNTSPSAASCSAIEPDLELGKEELSEPTRH